MSTKLLCAVRYEGVHVSRLNTSKIALLKVLRLYVIRRIPKEICSGIKRADWLLMSSRKVRPSAMKLHTRPCEAGKCHAWHRLMLVTRVTSSFLIVVQCRVSFRNVRGKQACRSPEAVMYRPISRGTASTFVVYWSHRKLVLEIQSS